MLQSGPKSYYDEYLRKKGSNRISSDPPSLLTDRGAYVNFLEVQLERVSSACLGVQAYDERFNDMQALIVAIDNRCNATTKLVSLAQNCAEEVRAEADSKIDAIIRAAKEDHSNAKIVWENLMSKIIGVERMCSVLPTHESRINALDRTLNQLADELANDQEQNRLVQKALLDRIIKLESEQREAFQLIELNRQTIGNLTNTVEENNKVLRTLLNQQNAKVLEHVATNREELSNKVLSMETRLTAELDTVKQDLAVKEAMDFSALKSQCDDLTEFVENIQSHIDEQVDRVEHSIDGKMEKLQEMIAPKIELIHECQQEQLEQIVGIEGEVMSQIHNFDQALNVYFMQQEQLQQQLNLSTTTINNQILDIRNNYENINNSFSSLRNTGHDRLNSPTSSRRFPKVDRIDVSSPKVRGSRSPLARSGSNTPTRVSQLPRVFENRLGSPSFIRSSDDSNPKATTPKKIKLGTPTRANEDKGSTDQLVQNLLQMYKNDQKEIMERLNAMASENIKTEELPSQSRRSSLKQRQTTPIKRASISVPVEEQPVKEIEPQPSPLPIRRSSSVINIDSFAAADSNYEEVKKKYNLSPARLTYRRPSASERLLPLLDDELSFKQGIHQGPADPAWKPVKLFRKPSPPRKILSKQSETSNTPSNYRDGDGSSDKIGNRGGPSDSLVVPSFAASIATETSRSSLRKDDAAEHAVRSSGGQLARRHSFDAGRDSNATNSFSTVKQNHLADRERARASSAPRLLSSSIVKPTEASLAWFPYKDDNIIDRTSYHLKDVPPISSGFNPDRPAWKPSKSYRSLKNTMSSKTTVKKNKPAVATYNSQGGNMVTHALTSTTALNISKNDKTASSESKSESNNRQNISTFSKKATPSIISARYIGDDCSVITVSTIASDFLTKNSAVSVTNYSRTSDGGFNR